MMPIQTMKIVSQSCRKFSLATVVTLINILSSNSLLALFLLGAGASFERRIRIHAHSTRCGTKTINSVTNSIIE